MRIDITSMFFNSKIEGKTATAAWGTSIGQNKSRDCRIDDYKQDIVDMIIGMTYKSISDWDNLDVSKGSPDRDIIKCAVFDDVYINNNKVDDAQYVLLLVREHSQSHEGRLLISYAPYITYKGIPNQNCIDLMQNLIGCTSDGCWFVYDISIKNQSELHFSAVVVNNTSPMVYKGTSKERSNAWKSMIPGDDKGDKILSYPFQTIYYGTPGSGKSRRVKERVKESYFDEQELEEFVFRTTFHPDSDYASFVGCYKPNSKNKNLLNGNNYTESQLLTRFFDSKEGDNIKARYLYESLINTVDIRNLNLDANIIAEKLKEKGFDKTAYVGEANCMYRIYDWLKEDGYLIDSKISYEFTPQAFTKAYVKAWQNPGEPVYLIIEEINRGNCAQIFGDLFQLLDRKDGVSEYPIDADNDLKDYLEKELGVGHAGIANGKLRLPSNLNILATMNTSDQSLFPMDSAFKRRWSWQCVPIEYEEKKRDGSKNESYYFTINIDNNSYSWIDFLKKTNDKIYKATDSEDKQMGNFFITHDVDEDEFVDKVMFYLWNDVCKEEVRTKNNFFRNYIDDKKQEEKEFSFNDLFKNNRTELLLKFMEYIGVEPKETKQQIAESESEK